LDVNQLLQELVSELRESLGYYHTHAYLMEETTGDLVMVEGAGKVGRELKARNHRLKAGQGIIGLVARTGEYFLTNNVDEVENFVRNPLLPNTRSELAVPLRKGKDIIGVLDSQCETAGFFTQEDVSMLQTIADQAAIAIENGRLLTEREVTIEKLQEVDRLKSEFLTTMSHELRTPLNSILGFADVLLSGIDGDLTDYAQNDVRLIYNSGQHLLALINDILDISKIEAGLIEIVPESLDVREIIDNMVAASNSLFTQKPIELITEIAEHLPPVYADRTRLMQILMNLVGNAVAFTSEGQVTVKVILGDEPDKMLFTISDTGMGIPADQLPLLFERFKQVDMSKTRVHGGMGLGLATCKELVKMHNGWIGVRSEEGIGSEFYFTIPTVS
jgi:signal transduction histidine kinase